MTTTSTSTTTNKNNNSITTNSRMHRSHPQLSPVSSIHSSHRCIATIKDIILNITQSWGASSGLLGEQGRGGTSPKSNMSKALYCSCVCCPNSMSLSLLPVPRPCSPPVTSWTTTIIAVLFHIPLCLVEAIPTVLVNILLLLAVAIGSSPLCPSPSFHLAHLVFSSS